MGNNGNIIDVNINDLFIESMDKAWIELYGDPLSLYEKVLLACAKEVLKSAIGMQIEKQELEQRNITIFN